MSKALFWVLVASIFVAIIVMFVAFIIMRTKINKVKSENLAPVGDEVNNPAINREDHGKLLWDLKDKTKNPLDDQSMEFVINTVLRNGYKRLFIDNFEEKYEETTLKEKTNIQLTKATFDFALINFGDKTIDTIDDLMKRAEPKSLIVIVNAPRKSGSKELMSYLKYTGVRHEHQRIGEGIVLIAK